MNAGFRQAETDKASRLAMTQCPRPASRRPIIFTMGLLAVLVVGGTTGLIAGCSETLPPIAELSGATMGTSYSVKVSPPPDKATQTRLRRQIEQRLDLINRQMSTYLPDSDLSRFNASQSTAWQPVPPALAEITDRALAVSRGSDGAYDITIGPLVELWGFGSQGRRESPPTEGQIAAWLPAVGFDLLQARRQPPAIRKLAGGVHIDLSSIAKGWAVDRIGDLLLANGIDNFLVEIGGEVLARGTKAPETPWFVAVELPTKAGPATQSRQAHTVMALRNMAMATSGDYRNFFESEGQRYSHTIDPHTGRARRHALASVTVIADRCTDADAWATALMAAGDAAAPALAERHALKALLLIREEGGIRALQSRALKASGLLDGGS